MSNASNLSTLANVLDDGSDGQFLKSTGSGGVAFDTVAAGATVYSSASDLPLTGNTVGDMAYVSAATTAKVVNQATGSVSTEDATRLYIYSGTGWYSVAFITQNPTISTVQDASSNTTPFTLATDQTATVITITAADPEEVPLTYGYSVTDGSLNGSTVAQGTGSNSNVFTVTPHASNSATFEITFTASDGINQATSINEFSLTFVTVVSDSNHTTLLATATGTSDNNNITDSSSNSHSITINGDTTAGTFSPYRSGGYSWKFDGSNDNIQITDSTDFDFGSGDFTIEGFYKFNDTSTSQYLISIGGGSSNNSHFDVNLSSGNWRAGGLSDYMVSGVNTGIDTDSFHHFSLVRSSNNLKFYIDGTQIGSTVDVTGQTFDCSGNIRIGGFHSTGSFAFNGYFRDIRLVKGTAITPPSGGPTEPLEAITNTVLLLCHAPYLKDGSSNDHSITINGSPTSEPFSPYDYTEYDAADHGGSVYFDGTGDYLVVPADTSLTFGTGDFTLEFWINFNTFPSNGYILNKENSSGNDFTLQYYQNAIKTSNATVGSGWNHYSTGIGSLSLNTWYHIAYVRSGGTLKSYKNGVEINSASDSRNYNLNNAITVASRYPGDYPTNFYMTDFRIVKGTAVYTSAFPPPTAPLSSTNAELHIKGTDASIIDKSQGGNAKLTSGTTGSSTQVKFSGSKSIYFSGVDGEGLSLPYNTLQIAAGEPWTIEFWFWIADGGGTRNGIFIQQGDGSVAYPPIRIDLRVDATQGISPSCQLSSSSGAYGNSITGYEWQSYETWHHVAFVSNGTTVTRYINGTAYSTMSDNHYTSTSTDDVTIGGRSSSSEYRHVHAGYYQDIRITKGLARYTASDETSNIPSAPLEG